MNITFSSKIKDYKTGLFFTSLKQIEESVKDWGENNFDCVMLEYTASHILEVTTLSGFTYKIELAQNDGYFIIEYDGAFNGFLRQELMPKFQEQKILDFSSRIYGKFHELALTSMMLRSLIEEARELGIKNYKGMSMLLDCMCYDFDAEVLKDINTNRFFKEPSGSIHRVKPSWIDTMKACIDAGYEEVYSAYIQHDVRVGDRIEQYYIWENLDKIQDGRDVISFPIIAETGIKMKLKKRQVASSAEAFFCLVQQNPVVYRCYKADLSPEIEEYRILESEYNDLVEFEMLGEVFHTYSVKSFLMEVHQALYKYEK